MWTYEFEEDGGYDCMTGAFVLKRDGRPLIVIDLENFGQASGQRPPPPEAVAEAEQLALKIVKALNEFGHEDHD